MPSSQTTAITTNVTRPETLTIQTVPRIEFASELPVSVTEATGVNINAPSTDLSLFAFDQNMGEDQNLALISGMCAPVTFPANQSSAQKMQRRKSSLDDFSAHTLLML